MNIVQQSAFSGQLSSGKALFDAQQAKKDLPRQWVIIGELQETVLADSLLLRAEGLKK